MKEDNLLYTSVFKKKRLVLTSWLLFAFLIGLNSCALRLDYNKHFENNIEQELEIRNFFKKKSNFSGNIQLANGEHYQLVQGRNIINHYSERKDIIFVEIENSRIAKLEKYDTLLKEQRILHKEWLVNSNEYSCTTTDLKGKILHFYSRRYPPGKHYSSYRDTAIDSLGQEFTEWGTIRYK